MPIDSDCFVVERKIGCKVKSNYFKQWDPSMDLFIRKCICMIVSRGIVDTGMSTIVNRKQSTGISVDYSYRLWQTVDRVDRTVDRAYRLF